MSELSFWTEARRVEVRFERRDPPLERLIAELRHVSGVYSLEVEGLVLRVGLSGQRTTRNETSGLGQRLRHHLDAAYGDQAARKAEFYDHFEFHAELIGRTMTIRWMPCPHETLRDAERDAIQGAPGGVLWRAASLREVGGKALPGPSWRAGGSAEGRSRPGVVTSARRRTGVWLQGVAPVLASS